MISKRSSLVLAVGSKSTSLYAEISFVSPGVGGGGEDGKVGDWFIYVRVWARGQFAGIFFSLFCSVFVLLLFVLSWLVHGSCVYFIVPFLLSLSLVLLTRHYWCISKVRFLISTLWISLKKGELFDFSHPKGSLPFKDFTPFYSSQLDFYVKFIISPC